MIMMMTVGGGFGLAAATQAHPPFLAQTRGDSRAVACVALSRASNFWAQTYKRASFQWSEARQVASCFGLTLLAPCCPTRREPGPASNSQAALRSLSWSLRPD